MGATMAIRCDRNLHVLTIILRESSTIQESDNLADGVVADYAADGRLVGLEITDACTDADLRTVTLESLPTTRFSMTLLLLSST